MNTDQRFNNPNINHGTRVYSAGVGSKGPTLERLPDIKNIYIFFPMAVATLPATMDKTKPLQNTPANIIHHQKQTKYIYIFPPEGVLVSIKQEPKKKKKKNYYRDLRRYCLCGLSHTGSAATNKKTTLIPCEDL
jgi:hypothetical protein